MGISLTRPAVPKVRDHTQTAPPPLVGVRRAHRLRHLRGDRARDGHEVEAGRSVVDRHLTSLARAERVAEDLVTRVLDRVAAPQKDASLAVLREHQILRVESMRAPDLGRAFALVHHVEADSTLALRLVHGRVKFLHLDHCRYDFQAGLLVEAGVLRWIVHDAFRVHHTVAVNRCHVLWVEEVEVGAESAAESRVEGFIADATGIGISSSD